MSIHGLWNGGHGNYAPAGNEDLERFETIEAAHEALLARHEDGHYAHDFDFVNRPSERVGTPCVGDDCYIDLYLGLDIDPDTGDVMVHDNGPDIRVRLDPHRPGQTCTD